MSALPALPTKLLVVGNDNPELFRSRAEQLGVRYRCHWELSSPDVLEFYAAADVYVSPSREDSFGLPVAEAMACGLPAITSVCAGVAECIHDGADGFVLREPQDAQSLSKLIERLQGEPDLRRKIGEAAAKNALLWNWDRPAVTVWELLKDIDAKRSPSDC